MNWFRRLLQKKKAFQEIPQLEVILLEEGTDVTNKDHFVVRGEYMKLELREISL